MIRPRIAVTLAALLAASLPAQDADQLREQLSKARRDLQQIRGEADALLDARIHHDLGLPLDPDLEVFRTDGSAAPTPTLERARQQLAEENATTAGLLGRYEGLRRQVEALRAAAALQAQAQREDEEWITVPAPGAPLRRAEPDPALPKRDPAGVTPPAAVPVGETSPPPVRVVANLPPIRAQINGSTDHGRVAQALFKAGQALTDRADGLRAQGQGAAADQLYDEARQRLERAVEELRPITDGGQPEFTDLFHLGKCRELLFRVAERRDGLSVQKDAKDYQRREQAVREPFVAITARDVVIRAGVAQPGAWGRAAQAAMDHFRWINLHANYAPKTDLDSITWPGRTER